MAILRDVLVHAFNADIDLTAAHDLLGTPALSQAVFHVPPLRQADATNGTRFVAADHAETLRLFRPVPHILCVAFQLTTDRAGRAPQTSSDPMTGNASPIQSLNLVTFCLAQVRIAHVQLHLPVKLCRLPHLNHFTALGVALRN